MIDPGDNFVDSVIDTLGEPPAFEPMAYYDPSGDTVEFLFSNEPYRGERIDGWVTVYLSEENDEVVGGLIKGVRRNLLKRYPGLEIEIEGDEVRIACLLRALAWETGDPVKLDVYKTVINKADETGFSANLQTA